MVSGISFTNELNGNSQQETYRGNHQQNYGQDASLQQELHHNIKLRDIKLDDSNENLNFAAQNNKTFHAERMKKNHDLNLVEFAKTKYDLKSVLQNGTDTDLIHFNGRPEVFHETQKQGI